VKTHGLPRLEHDILEVKLSAGVCGILLMERVTGKKAFWRGDAWRHFNKKKLSLGKISDAGDKAFSEQVPKRIIRYNESFHGRFLIIDDRELFLVGASLKGFGRKCVGFIKMDTGEICLKKAAFASSKDYSRRN